GGFLAGHVGCWAATAASSPCTRSRRSRPTTGPIKIGSIMPGPSMAGSVPPTKIATECSAIRQARRIRCTAPASSKRERPRLFHMRQFRYLGEYRGGDFLIDLDEADGIGAGRLAAQMAGRDVDAGIAEPCAERADEAGLVHIGDIEHVRAEFRFKLDALDLDDTRLAVREHRAGDRALHRIGPDRHPDV